MSGRKINFVWAITVSCLVLIAGGCNKYDRYEVLTFFFTGVPHPDGKTDITDPEDSSASMREKSRRKAMARRTKVFTHGPYAAKECYKCHDSKTTATLLDKGKTGTVMPRWEGRMPGRLVAPLKELCLECHTSKSAGSAYSKNLWIHGPVSDGLCTICHSPHQSRNPYLLKKESSYEMCTSCHGKGYLFETEDHQPGKECLTCHNAHLGKNRFLLKKDFDEIF
jgi:predicted CXXCH cytochrome family protein